jgi:hypothetical protein
MRRLTIAVYLGIAGVAVLTVLGLFLIRALA